MSTTSPNPNNLLILAAVGIAAYWMMTRRAIARPVYTTGANGQQNGQNLNGAAHLLNAGVNLIDRLFKPGKQNTIIANAAEAANRDENPDLNGSVADWVSQDGLAVNPPNGTSAYDFADTYFSPLP